MKTITGEEFDHMGAAAVLQMVREGKESVGILSKTTGTVSMIIPYMPPQHACECVPGERHWICLTCDGDVRADLTSSPTTEKP